MTSRHWDSRLILLGVFVLLLVAFVPTDVHAEKEIPVTKFGQNVGGPTMTFLYW